jgi:hypothetical protein
MLRISAVLIMIAALLLAQGAGAAFAGATAPDAGATALTVTSGAPDTPEPAGHDHGTTHHCTFAACTATFLAGRMATTADHQPMISHRWIPGDDRAVKAATLRKDPPVPRLPA